MSRLLTRAGVVVLVATVAVAATAAPASAHGTGPGPSDYRSAVVAVQPATPGVTVRVREAGNVVELVNRSGDDVVVYGYENEPYLRVGPAGVFENRRSPSRYRNATPEQVPPAAARRDAPPEWVRRSSGTVVRWHDHRTHGGAGIGGAVRAVPWSLRLSVDGRDAVVVGERAYVPGPSPWPSLAAAAVLAGAIITVGVRRPRGWALVLAATLGTAVGLDVARAAGGFAARVTDTLSNRLFDQFFFPALGWVAAAVAVCRLLRRPADLPFAAMFAALALFVLGGVGDLSVLWKSQLVFAGPAWLARAAAVTALGVGGGLGVLFVRELARPVAVAEAATDEQEASA